MPSEEVTYEELKPHYDAVRDFMNVKEVPDNQWPPKMKLMKEAAEKAGMGDRFRKLGLAVTFDDQWTYEKDFAKGEAASKTVVNAQGCEQGTCTWGTVTLGVMFTRRIRWIGIIFSGRRRRARRFGPCTW